MRREMAASGVSGLRESGASWERAGEMETAVAASAAARKQVRRKKAGMLAKVFGVFQSEESLRAAPRDLMKRVSDEALIKLDEKTLQLIAKRQ